MTAQIGETLHYRGESLTMATEPLESYFAMGGAHPGFAANSTALHRGYVGSWEITRERLYLVELTATLDGGMPASLESIFPGVPGSRVRPLVLRHPAYPAGQAAALRPRGLPECVRARPDARDRKGRRPAHMGAGRTCTGTSGDSAATGEGSR
jgi:hypothetical protein